MRTRIKICGITRIEDAQAAVAAGADALGFVFYPPSPRAVDAARAASIISRLPAFITTVALFVDEQPEVIREVIAQTQVDLLQFHGAEATEDCAAFDRPWIKAVRMKADVDLNALASQYQAARALLLDAWHPELPGGTGEVFDWSRIPAEFAGRIILAGGLDADNVTQAVRTVRPYAVDVSGGVEAAKGIKDADKIARFVRGVRIADE